MGQAAALEREQVEIDRVDVGVVVGTVVVVLGVVRQEQALEMCCQVV